MSLQNTSDSYGSVTKWFHWIGAVLIIGMLCLGTTVALVTNKTLGAQLVFIHKSFGLLVLAYVIVRWLWRVFNKIPNPINIHNTMLQKLLPWFHEGLYLLVFLMPISGILMNAFKHYTIPFFGLFSIKTTNFPKNIPLHEFFHTMHLIVACILGTMLIIHMGAATKHHFYNKDDTLRRMLPGRKTTV